MGSQGGSHEEIRVLVTGFGVSLLPPTATDRQAHGVPMSVLPAVEHAC